MEAINILTTDNCVILIETYTKIDYYSPYTNRVYSESVYDIVNRNAQHDLDFSNNNIDHQLKFDLESAVSKEHCALITPINSAIITFVYRHNGSYYTSTPLLWQKGHRPHLYTIGTRSLVKLMKTIDFSQLSHHSDDG